MALNRLLDDVRGAHTPFPFTSGSGPASQLFEGRVKQSHQAFWKLGRSLTL